MAILGLNPCRHRVCCVYASSLGAVVTIHSYIHELSEPESPVSKAKILPFVLVLPRVFACFSTSLEYVVIDSDTECCILTTPSLRVDFAEFRFCTRRDQFTILSEYGVHIYLQGAVACPLAI